MSLMRNATGFIMKKQLHEFTKEELIEIIQDYQEMVNDLEEYINEHGFASEETTEFREILYKERPGWKIHQDPPVAKEILQ